MASAQNSVGRPCISNLLICPDILPGGGQNTWTVYLTGTNNNVGAVDSSGSAIVASTSSAQLTTFLTSPSSPPSSGTTALSEGAALLVSTPSTAQAITTSFATSVIAPTTVVAISVISMTPSILTVGGATIVQTVGAATATSTPVPTSSNFQKPQTRHSTNTAGIAAGVVVGIVALAAIIGGSVYYVKRRNRESQSNGHRRNTSLNAFTPGAGIRRQVSDSRLDPAMVEKRRSGGSVFADNVDYSRRILKVTNPDGT